MRTVTIMRRISSGMALRKMIMRRRMMMMRMITTAGVLLPHLAGGPWLSVAARY